MASVEKTKALRTEINSVLAFRDAKLVTRPEWGEINFVEAERDLKNIFSITGTLEGLPVEDLSDNVSERIARTLASLKPYLNNINTFTITKNNAPQLRTEHVQQIHEAANNVLETVTQWIPFLAYQKGDISENISKLTKAVAQADSVLESTKQDIQKKALEIDSIVVQAREASASAGAAVFTQDFLREVEILDGQCKPWLAAASVFAALTFLIAGATWFWTPAGLDHGQILQKVASKLVALSVLLTATVWCGRMYNADFVIDDRVFRSLLTSGRSVATLVARLIG